ncbi:MAG: hypothetical protein EP343_09120 [Deltaproteobacteria bacterium]|nr:MAG: hypothetical protein EP343_09120 [Deltaproteobacteria bacterium]
MVADPSPSTHAMRIYKLFVMMFLMMLAFVLFAAAFLLGVTAFTRYSSTTLHSVVYASLAVVLFLGFVFLARRCGRVSDELEGYDLQVLEEHPELVLASWNEGEKDVAIATTGLVVEGRFRPFRRYFFFRSKLSNIRVIPSGADGSPSFGFHFYYGAFWISHHREFVVHPPMDLLPKVEEAVSFLEAKYPVSRSDSE